MLKVDEARHIHELDTWLKRCQEIRLRVNNDPHILTINFYENVLGVEIKNNVGLTIEEIRAHTYNFVLGKIDAKIAQLKQSLIEVGAMDTKGEYL